MSSFDIIQQDSKQCNIKISGAFDRFNIKKLYSNVKKVKHGKFAIVTIDCTELDALDFAGAILLSDLSADFSEAKIPFVMVGMNPEFKSIMLFARKNLRQKSKIPIKKHNFIVSSVQKMGKLFVDLFESFMLFSTFLGQSTIEFGRVLTRPWKFRYKATAVHIEKSGAQALPIVALTSFLVGLVIAYQGAEQLAKFGANIFIVELVSVSMFRELAPLIAAIVIAGRSASSYTAEIGTMKITQEIDAMKTMGFDPILFLVLPRMFALLIAMPLIVFFADIIGVFGGMIVAKYQLGISYLEFVIRLRDAIEVKHILIGLFKAPFFGLLIALIGCFRGFQVSGSTESIGQYTTISVVNAIFWVIACNALISVVLTKVGI
ncbi:MAG: MlaE family lipid ABC transporter permease subunit [Sulfurospirillaceae bacterium]|nr:MlaE family lipid ABC transporter permease subunit [Sulfurospirillaceae bacterium]